MSLLDDLVFIISCRANNSLGEKMVFDNVIQYFLDRKKKPLASHCGVLCEVGGTCLGIIK